MDEDGLLDGERIDLGNAGTLAVAVVIKLLRGGETGAGRGEHAEGQITLVVLKRDDVVRVVAVDGLGQFFEHEVPVAIVGEAVRHGAELNTAALLDDVGQFVRHEPRAIQHVVFGGGGPERVDGIERAGLVAILVIHLHEVVVGVVGEAFSDLLAEGRTLRLLRHGDVHADALVQRVVGHARIVSTRINTPGDIPDRVIFIRRPNQEMRRVAAKSAAFVHSGLLQEAVASHTRIVVILESIHPPTALTIRRMGDAGQPTTGVVSEISRDNRSALALDGFGVEHVAPVVVSRGGHRAARIGGGPGQVFAQVHVELILEPHFPPRLAAAHPGKLHLDPSSRAKPFVVGKPPRPLRAIRHDIAVVIRVVAARPLAQHAQITVMPLGVVAPAGVLVERALVNHLRHVSARMDDARAE